MKGIERSIDKLGRIVLPISFREQLGLNTEDKILVTLENGKIILSPSKTICAVCGNDILESSDIQICSRCIKIVKEKY